MPKNWEVRVNGYRMSGDEFRTWEQAKERVWTMINRLEWEAQREGASYADDIGRAKSDFLNLYLRQAKQRKRDNLTIYIPQADKMRRIDLNRLPW